VLKTLIEGVANYLIVSVVALLNSLIAGISGLSWLVVVPSPSSPL